MGGKCGKAPPWSFCETRCCAGSANAKTQSRVPFASPISHCVVRMFLFRSIAFVGYISSEMSVC